MPKLTIKQQKFINEYLKTGNATFSAYKAGYSKKTAHSIGSENLQKPDIKSEIERRLQRKMDKKIAQADEVLEFMSKAMRGKVKEEQIVVEGTGQGYSQAKIMKKQIATRDRLRAAEQLAKRYGLLIERVDITSEASQHLQSIADQFRKTNSEANINDDVDMLED